MKSARRARRLYLLFAFALPMLLVGYANASYTYNHFYAGGAFLLDAGWFSGVIYRNGVSLPNPLVADPHPLYWDMHVSPLFLATSLISYLVPLDRIDFFWVYQGLLHIPFAAAVALLLGPTARPRKVSGIMMVGIAALSFSFSGQALACMGFPHYEIVIVGGVCIMLAGLATGRLQLAWLGIALAVFTREDGGGHACAFLAAVVVSGLLGRPFPVRRRDLFVMIAVAALATILMMAFQRVAFPGGSLFKHEYLGDPPYAHITRAAFGLRLEALLHRSQFVVYPFGLALLLATLDRDPRWMLGYLVTVPWFFLNLLAVQALKPTFDVYTGFPFLGSIFWLGAYGVVKHGAKTAALWRMVPVCLVSTCGSFLAAPAWMGHQIDTMLMPRSVNAPGIRAFARGLRAGAYGPVLTEPSVASLALETLPRNANFDGRFDISHPEGFDSFAFYYGNFMGSRVFDPIVRGGFSSCASLPESEVVFCTRPGHSFPSDFVPFHLFIANLERMGTGGKKVGKQRLVVQPGDPTQIAVYGPLMPLPAGRYRATTELRPAAAETTCEVPVRIEAFNFIRNESLGKLDVAPGAGVMSLDFEVPANVTLEQYSELRFFHATCPYELVQLDIVGLPRR